MSIDIRLQSIIWYTSHALLFLWFAVFITPRKNSDRANVLYFWAISFSTLLLMISSICHIPRFFGSDSALLQDIVAFAWTIAPLAAISLEALSKVSRRISGYSFASPLRSILSNTLLVTIAMSIQYMTCLESGLLRGESGTKRHSSTFDIGYMHCAMLDSPRYVVIPIALTVILLFSISELLSRVMGSSFRFFQSRHKRHGKGWFDKSPVGLPMVPWFSLSLTTTAIQLLVSLKVFVGRLDIRHILRAVCKDDSDVIYDLRAQEGWFDFFSDGGDGFNSSYAVGRMLAQPNLTVRVAKSLKITCKSSPSLRRAVTPKSEGVHSSVVQRRIAKHHNLLSSSSEDSLILPRSSVVIHGGDLAYPRPSSQTYRTRFIGPLGAALPAGPGGNRPRMFLIPGNHDHYDGLESYVRWILGSGSLGGWKLPQRCSYFALWLREGWWVLGVDLGLTNDLDVFQYQTFSEIIDSRIEKTDRVVVVSHRPQWVSDPYAGVITGDLFHQLMDRIGEERLAMRLAGDLHHYMRFGGPGLCPLVTSGGGGAFLHPTHVLDASLVNEYDLNSKRRCAECEEEESLVVNSPPSEKKKKKTMMGGRKSEIRYSKISSFPTDADSRKLAWLNLLKFRDKNWGADIIFGTLYCCMSVSLLPICSAAAVVTAIAKFQASHSFFQALFFALFTFFADMVLPALKQVYLDSTFALIFHVAFFFICFAGAQGKRGDQTQRWMIAITHFFFHSLAAVSVVCLVELCVELLSRVHVVPELSRVPGIIKIFDETLNAPISESALRAFLRFMDFPSSLIRNRLPLCNASDPARDLLFRYLWRVIPFVWLLATPTAAKIMGTYLFLCVNWLGLHLNESFSSLRIEDFKHFLRMRIDPDSGDLHVYVIGVEQVPREWEADPAWDPLLFSAVPGTPLPPSSKWVTPSRWKPKAGQKESDANLVDYFVVPRITRI